MNRPYGGRRGAPRPPRHLEAQMEAAGRDNDQDRLTILAAQYDAWLTEHGHPGRPHQGTTAPDHAYLPEPEDNA